MTETRIKNCHAVALGRLGRGVPKRFSLAERRRRRARMIAYNRTRAEAKARAQTQEAPHA
ncbi:MAG: hypothetical protein ABSG50_15755 [Opitutaceae bacterium]|jgi:hypothetical protein